MHEREPSYHNIAGVAALRPELLVEVYQLDLVNAQTMEEKFKYAQILVNVLSRALQDDQQ